MLTKDHKKTSLHQLKSSGTFFSAKPEPKKNIVQQKQLPTLNSVGAGPIIQKKEDVQQEETVTSETVQTKLAGAAALPNNNTTTPAQLQTLSNPQGIGITTNDNSASQKENKTGLPNQLKAGVEQLSGHSMDDVKVHYNSNKPAQLQAHAYAQGTDIHMAPGQEKHLPHEAWHVAQQKQGRVKATKQMKGKVNVNDDAGLEKEADVMGAKAMQLKQGNDSNSVQALQTNSSSNNASPTQLFSYKKGIMSGSWQGYTSSWRDEKAEKEWKILETLFKKIEKLVTQVELDENQESEFNSLKDKEVTYEEKGKIKTQLNNLKKKLNQKKNQKDQAAAAKKAKQKEEEKNRVEAEKAAKKAKAEEKKKANQKTKTKATKKPKKVAKKETDPLKMWVNDYEYKGVGRKQQIKYLQDQINAEWKNFSLPYNELVELAEKETNTGITNQMNQVITSNKWQQFDGKIRFDEWLKSAQKKVTGVKANLKRAKRGWNYLVKPLKEDIWWKQLPKATNDQIKKIATHANTTQHTSDHRPETIDAFQTTLLNHHYKEETGKLVMENGSHHSYDNTPENKGGLTILQSPQCLEMVYQYAWTNGTQFGNKNKGGTKKKLNEIPIFNDKGAETKKVKLTNPLVVIVNTLSNDLSKEPGTAYIKN